MKKVFLESDYVDIPPVKQKKGPTKKIDITQGQRFGLLTTITQKYNPKYKNAVYWLCQCDCGKQKIVRDTNLSNNLTTSCNCLRKIVGKTNKTWKGYEKISSCYYNYLIHSACVRNHIFDVSIIQLWELYIKQNRKCAFTGLDIHFSKKSGGTDGTVSLDRIDNNKGYMIDNIQWVHKSINLMRGSHTISEFLYYCNLVTQNYGNHIS